MNKQERKMKGFYKWQKRIKNYRMEGTNSHILKTTGKPCSCAMCSPGKVEDKAKYREPLSREHHSINN